MTQDRGLIVTGISKSYGATRAPSDVSLAIPAGQVVALIGHNGAGKSTLLRTLSGAETPEAGSIHIDGRRAEFHRPAEANAAGIAAVYQELTLVNELTVAENLFLGAERLVGPMLDRRVMNAEADAICAEYGIQAMATSRVADLSVAQRQLLEVARAIHRDARLLLLDEPTKGVDIRDFAEQGGAVLVVSSEGEELLEVADRIVVFRNGACDGAAVPEIELSVATLRRAAWAHAE